MVDSIFSFLLTLFGLFVLLNSRFKSLALDKPNERSLHSQIIPRTGGLAIMSGVLLTWLFIGVSLDWLLLPLALIAISLVDDIRGLKARWRLLAQIIVCTIFIFLNPYEFPFWAMLILILACVWMVNLYNFMDGSDGLAGGMAVFGFGTYAIAAYLNGNPDLFALSVSIVGASIAFLIFNFHPAKIFMGDSGSVPLGFLAAAIGLTGWQQGTWPGWFPLMAFSPFIVDASVTLIKRMIRRERIWEAHKFHYYQRLVQMGWGHRKTAMAEYIVMLAVGVSSLYASMLQAWMMMVVIIGWVIVYTVIMLKIDRVWAQRQR